MDIYMCVYINKIILRRVLFVPRPKFMSMFFVSILVLSPHGLLLFKCKVAV